MRSPVLSPRFTCGFAPFLFLFLLCLAKTSYTYKMNDLPQSSSSLGLFR